MFVIFGTVVAQNMDVGALILCSCPESSEAKQVIQDLESAKLTLKGQQVSWLPGLSLEAPKAINIDDISGDRKFSASARVALDQNLPGNGTFQAAVSHSVAWNEAMDAFAQAPAFSASVSQPLGPGVFGLYGDPGQGLAVIALKKAEITYQETMDALFLRAVGIARDADLAYADWEHKTALSHAAQLARSEAETLCAQGRVSRGDFWKAEMAARTAERNMITARYALETAKDAWSRFFGQEYSPLSDADRESVFALGNNVKAGVRESAEYLLLRAEAERLARSRDADILKRAPALVASVSTQPDPLLNTVASTFKDSFDALSSKDMKWPVQASFGVSIKLGFPFSDWYERDRFNLALEKNRLAAASVLEQDNQERDRLKNRIEGLEALLAFLDEEAERETQNAADRDALRASGEITRGEYAVEAASALGFGLERLTAKWEFCLARFEYAVRAGLSAMAR